jgi:hypothetical protein
LSAEVAVASALVRSTGERASCWFSVGASDKVGRVASVVGVANAIVSRALVEAASLDGAIVSAKDVSARCDLGTVNDAVGDVTIDASSLRHSFAAEILDDRWEGAKLVCRRGTSSCR